MYQEFNFMTEILDKRGVKEGDRMVVKPFFEKEKTFCLNRVQYDFVSHGDNSTACYKVLGAVQGEKLHYQLKRHTTQNFNKKSHQRYFLKSLCHLPFKINGSFVMEAFIEVGDVCDLGFHSITFLSKESLRSNFQLEHDVLEKNRKILSSDLPVLLEGETGVGKTRLAKKIHEVSGKTGRFMHLNVAALNQSLVESELFGHHKGSFTGAITDKPGAIKMSHKGTLFLDEIDSLSIDLQTKLLLFLDDQQIKPVGSALSESVQTRIICSSGKKLMNLVQEGKMRSDFYFRIASGMRIEIPALRDQPEKIRQFCQLYSIENNIVIANRLIDFYQTLPWPGNLRQLKGHLEKKSLSANGRKLDFDAIDDELVKMSSSLMAINELGQCFTLDQMRLHYAKKVYFECNRNLELASKKLGVTIRTLKRMVGTKAA